jgi:hypothetical protein
MLAISRSTRLRRILGSSLPSSDSITFNNTTLAISSLGSTLIAPLRPQERKLKNDFFILVQFALFGDTLPTETRGICTIVNYYTPSYYMIQYDVKVRQKIKICPQPYSSV